MEVFIYSLFIFMLALDCNSFNLESRLPVIKKGREGSYFGFSVAEHQSLNEGRDEIERSWMLVGAPLDMNKQPKTNRSGALWSCPITTRYDDCYQVTTDGKRTVDDNELMPPLDDEVKDGQWMGVTVRSQGAGGKVMVCAHRYIRSGEDYRFGGGLCYTLTQRLDYDESWEPCKGRPTNRGHEQYGYCQAGTSGLLMNDTALIGTPGPYTWRGTVFVFSVSDDFLNREKTVYYTPLTAADNPPVDHYSYLGMSVAAGELLGQEMYIAAGAPRSNGTGQVVIFKKVRPSVTIMKRMKILSGEQFTSNFGYEMTIADVNGDKLPDLLVGAPNYFTKDSGGAVYVYINKNYCLDCQRPIKITGKPESRFGIAITNLGDLNKDGFDDIAIGAPYEDRGVVYIYLGSSKGVITEPSQIIHGKELGDLTTFGYSLSGGLDLDTNGYPDLLIGAFESSTIVMLRARPIVDLVTTVGPPSALSNIDPNIKKCEHHPDINLTCFSFEACVSVKSIVEGRLGESMKLRYKLEADISRKFSRVTFDPHGVRQHILEKDITLFRDSNTNQFTHCNKHVAFIKEGTKDIQSGINMRLNYQLVQEEPRRPRQGEPLPSVDRLPILNQQQAAKVFQATFLKDCGDNDICESQLVVESFLDLPSIGPDRDWELVLGEHNEVKLSATVHNLRESAYEASLNIYHPPSLSYIGFSKQFKAGHSCDVVNSTLVVCSMGNPLSRDASSQIVVRFDPKNLDDAITRLEIVVVANSTSQLVEPQGPLPLRATVINKADLKLIGRGNPESIFYGGKVIGESAMKYKDDVGAKVFHYYQVVNSGPWRVRDLKVVIDWPYQVANNKPLGKWLLYLDERPTVEAYGGGECTLPENYVNPLNLQSRSAVIPSVIPGDSTMDHSSQSPQTNGSSSRRKKRDIEQVVKTINYTDPITGKVTPIVPLNCEKETAKCLKIVCKIYNLEKNQEATIYIKSRLWNGTLVEDYSQVSEVRISSVGRIILPPNINIQQDNVDDIARVQLTAWRDKRGEVSPEDLPVWLIILAVLAGLFILFVLILCLYKCGFFTRKRPHDPTLSADAILDKTKPDDYDY